MAYVALAAFKPWVSIPDSTTDAETQMALDAASAAIDVVTNIYPGGYAPAASDTTRIYTADTSSKVFIGAVSSITSVSSAGVAIASGDYKARPSNAAADGKPYTWLTSEGLFSTDEENISVVGRHGWPTIPYQVSQFTTILASKLLKRTREAPWGVVSGGLDGIAIRLARTDPDLQLLLGGLNHPVIG